MSAELEFEKQVAILGELRAPAAHALIIRGSQFLRSLIYIIHGFEKYLYTQPRIIRDTFF